MLAVKFILISSILAFGHAKLVMDDLMMEVNSEYVDISSNLVKEDEGALFDCEIDLKKDVNNAVGKFSLKLYMDGDYQEIQKMEVDLCADKIEDELVKYIFDEIEKFGNLKLHCPIKKGHYSIQGMKLEDNEVFKIFNKGKFRTNVEIFSNENGESKNVMTFQVHAQLM